MILQTQGHDSTTIPPRQLRIEDAHPEGTKPIRTTKKPDPPKPQSTPLSSGSRHHSQWHSPGIAVTPYQHRRWLEMASSDLAEQLDDPTLFPRVIAWLQELDSGPRGADGHNFAQYGELLEQKMFKRVFQLESLTDDKLMTVCDTMAPGTATLILQYACKDCGKIRKKEIQRFREARLQPKWYL